MHGAWIVVSGMPEVAVTIDMDKGHGCLSPHARKGSQKDGAIPAHDDWELVLARSRDDGIGEHEIKRADGVAVAQPRARLLSALVSWAGKIDYLHGR